MGHMLKWPESSALLALHSQDTFNPGDAIEIPPMKAAALYRDASLTGISREGEIMQLGKGVFRKKAKLYLIDLSSTRTIPWGCPDIQTGERAGGCHGQISLKVTSPQLLLNAFIGAPLPLTAEGAVNEILPGLQVLIRQEALKITGRLDTTELRARIIEAVLKGSADTLDERGLAIAKFEIEDFFFPEEEMEV